MPKEPESSTGSISLAREIRGQFLVWLGIFGSILTISTHWAKFIKLAGWMRLIVDNFSYGIVWFWQRLGGIIHIEIPDLLAKTLTFMFFWISLTIGSILIAGYMRRPYTKTWVIIGIYPLLCVIETFILGTSLDNQKYVYIFSNLHIILAICAALVLTEGRILTRLACVIMLSCILYLTLDLYEAFDLSFLRYRAVLEPSYDIKLYVRQYIGILLEFTVLLLPIILAPTKALAKRLSFVLMGVALVFVLSEASKLIEGLEPAASTIQAH
jgi:hypothetical protein